MCLWLERERGGGLSPVRGCRVWRLHGADREGPVARVFGERMCAGAVLVGAGEVRRDVGIDCFRVGCGMLLDSGRLGGRVEGEGCGLGEGGGGVCSSCGGAWEVRVRMRV